MKKRTSNLVSIKHITNSDDCILFKVFSKNSGTKTKENAKCLRKKKAEGDFISF